LNSEIFESCLEEISHFYDFKVNFSFHSFQVALSHSISFNSFEGLMLIGVYNLNSGSFKPEILLNYTIIF